MEKVNIPSVNYRYHFFDDGKLSFSRHYVAFVEDIITPEEAKEVIIHHPFDWDDEKNETIWKDISLYDIWKEEIENHLQGDSFKVFNGSSTETGEPWLYSRDTEAFIKCSIPEYDKDPIWFVRTVCGEWFSLDTTSSWQSGLLDVDCIAFKELKSLYPKECKKIEIKQSKCDRCEKSCKSKEPVSFCSAYKWKLTMYDYKCAARFAIARAEARKERGY